MMQSAGMSIESPFPWRSTLDLHTAFSEVRKKKSFFDITLSCQNEDGKSQSLRAHKLILTSYSPIFEEMLSEHPNTLDPLIYLKGIQFEDLEKLIDFMYDGKVNIPISKQASFLAAAEELKVKGLYENQVDVSLGPTPHKINLQKKKKSKDFNSGPQKTSELNSKRMKIEGSTASLISGSKLNLDPNDDTMIAVMPSLGEISFPVEEEQKKIKDKSTTIKKPKHKEAAKDPKRVKRVKPVGQGDAKDQSQNTERSTPILRVTEDGLKENDLVIATVKGFKPWPAKITEVLESGECKVHFYVTKNVNYTNKKVYSTKVVKYDNASKSMLEKDQSDRMKEAIEEIEADRTQYLAELAGIRMAQSD